MTAHSGVAICDCGGLSFMVHIETEWAGSNFICGLECVSCKTVLKVPATPAPNIHNALSWLAEITTYEG